MWDVHLFVAALPDELQGQAVADAALEARLAALLQEARATWPEIDVSPLVFFRELASKVSAGGSFIDRLCAVDAKEVYIASACANGDQAAIAAFEQRYFRVIEPALARLGAPAALVGDVKQILREKLFVGGDATSVLKYAGRGELEGLVRVSAVRWALHHMRTGDREVLSQTPLDVSAAEDDPELQLLKMRYRAEFKSAFEEAMKSLSSRQRNVMRLHVVADLSAERIGQMYRVHRVTAHRWLTQAREQLAEKTRQLLTRRLRIPESDFDSLNRLVESQLNISVQRI